MKTVLLTGATSGIGLATANYLSENGYQLIIVGRNMEKTQNVCSKLKNCCTSYVVNLIDYSQIDQMFLDIKSKGITLSGLVHCAGYEGKHSPVRTISMDVVEQLMSLHFGSFVEMGRCFYKRSISEDGSSMIAISSLAGELCNKNSLDYSASKTALNSAVKVMSKEFVKRRIRVNAILPGYVDTQMNHDLGEFIDIDKIQPFGLIDPLQIACFVDFLLSDKSKFITGACLPISGGFCHV